MKVLIIGGMGVIGGAITTAASKHGHDITVVSRRELTSEWNLPGVCGISGNWKDKDFASNVVKEVFDVIVDTQVFDVKQIIRSMDIVNGHCKQYIYISTDSVYKHPAMELREDEPIDFKDIYWDYGIKKREAELYLLNNGDRYDFNWSVIRPTITFGNTRIPVGYASRRNTYTLAERILSGKPIIRFDNPDSRHAVCHTSVFGEATVGMFLNEKAYGQFLHISDDYAFTYGEIFEAIESALGKKGIYISVPTDSIKNLSRNVYEEMVYDKNPDFILDNSKIKDISPNVNYLIDMKEPMKETLTYIKANSTSQDEEYNLITDCILVEQINKLKNEEQRKLVMSYINKLPNEYLDKLKQFKKQRKFECMLLPLKKLKRNIKTVLIDKVKINH